VLEIGWPIYLVSILEWWHHISWLVCQQFQNLAEEVNSVKIICHMSEYQEQTYTVQHNPLQCQGTDFVLWYLSLPLGVISADNIYRMFSAQADWTLTHTSHKDTEQSTIEASVTLDGITLTDPLIRWSPNECDNKTVYKINFKVAW
jgi:hypothetical protein